MIKTLKSLLLHKNIMSTPDKKYGFFIFLAGTSIFSDTFCGMRFPSSFLISLFKIKLNEKFSRGSLIPLILTTRGWFWCLCRIGYIKLQMSCKRCTPGSETIFGNWKPFKDDEKGFLFHLKSSFRSQDI